MLLFWLGLALMCSVPLALVATLFALYFYLCHRYLHWIVRIFQEKPLFVVPRGQTNPDAEDVAFPTTGGLTLRGCYLRAAQPRRGVILFGLEFGSNRWSCQAYCDHLVKAGFDVFAFEVRNQGDSDSLPGYEPLQWLTSYEIEDAQAALAYLKSRPDADPRGVGFFGISRGAAAGLAAGSRDNYVRCFVTDGVYATYSVLVPYIRTWYRIYNNQYRLQGLLPSWYYGVIGMAALRQVGRERCCWFPSLELAVRKLRPRPVLMIHGEGDTYVRTTMARSLFAWVRRPKEFWLVEGAKHNQAIHVAGDEYRRRVLEFFERHLLGEAGSQTAATGDAEPATNESARRRTSSAVA